MFFAFITQLTSAELIQRKLLLILFFLLILLYLIVFIFIMDGAQFQT